MEVEITKTVRIKANVAIDDLPPDASGEMKLGLRVESIAVTLED